MIPLLHTIVDTPPAEVSLKLLEVFPEGAREMDGEGHLPIHIAALYNAPAEVSLKLLEHFPEGAREKDGEGRLPIHFTSENNAPAEVSLKLLELFPGGAREKQGEYGSLPIHLGVDGGVVAGAIRLLLHLLERGPSLPPSLVVPP